MNEDEIKSFFNLFSYTDFDDETDDCLYIYGRCIILRNVKTSSGELVAGQKYEDVWFDFKTCRFEFISYWKRNPNNNYWTPGPGSFVVNSSELAPYMVWRDEDLPKET
jgi:hypothetical protein